MPLHVVSKPNIAIPLTPEGDVRLRVRSIPTVAAAELYDAIAASGGKGFPFGTMARIILDSCLLEVEGTVLGVDGQEITDANARLTAARQAVWSQSDAVTELVMDTMAHLGAVPGNWRPAERAGRSDHQEPGTD